MKNKKIAIVTASTLGLFIYSNIASASMATDARLTFNPMVVACNGAEGSNLGTAPNNCNYGTKFESGSYYGIDSNDDDIFAIEELIPVETGTQGLLVNTAQTTAGSIDIEWMFLGEVGNHITTGSTSILSDDGAGNVTLDFSGWGWIWNGIAVDFGGGEQNCGTTLDGVCFDGVTDVSGLIDNGSQIATIACDFVCATGEGYTLDYAATVPLDHPSGFSGVSYILHLEGTVGEVPVPSAVWLFGSGLMGLLGFARRKA